MSSGIIIRKGTWYFLGEDRISQGRDNLVKEIEDKPPLLKKVDELVRKKLAEGADITTFGKTETVGVPEEN